MVARVSVVVRDPDLAQLLAEVLHEHGHEVQRDGEVDDVVGYLAREQPDLLILDVWWEMPAQGGDVVEHVREDQGQPTPTILIVGDKQEIAGREDWLAAHRIHALLAPFDVREFEQLVATALAER